MAEDRVRYGSLTATVGAALLAVSVFLPWYAVSFTANGVSFAQQQLNSAAAQFGNAALQSELSIVHAGVAALAGRQLATLTGHQALKYVNVVLLVLAAVAFVAALLRLAGAIELPAAGVDPIALVGVLATMCVLFRMVHPPAPGGAFLSLSLDGGIWLALASSLAIVVGGVWSRRRRSPSASAASSGNVWDQLSGWTPEL